jgi:hypothetical protein
LASSHQTEWCILSRKPTGRTVTIHDRIEEVS